MNSPIPPKMGSLRVGGRAQGRMFGSNPEAPIGCGSENGKIPKWVTLVSGNMGQNLRFAPPGKF